MKQSVLHAAATTDRPSFRRAPYSGDKIFTLIELLIVIAIIAILAGMLLPALNKARNTAKSAGCINNQKSIGSAINMYAGDNRGFIPDYRLYWVNRNGTSYQSWVVTAAAYLGYDIAKPDKNGCLLATPLPKVFNCPAVTPPCPNQNRSYHSHYGINKMISNGTHAGSLPEPCSTKLSQITNPSVLILTADAARGPLDSYDPQHAVHDTIIYYTAGGALKAKVINMAHENKSNVAFVAGNVSGIPFPRLSNLAVPGESIRWHWKKY